MTVVGQTYQSLQIKGSVQNFDISIICGTGNTTYEDLALYYPYSCNQAFFHNSLSYTEFCYLESAEQAYVASVVWPNYFGDQPFTVLSPIDQYVHDIEFITLPSSKFPSNFISITVSEEHFDPNSIILDGVPVDCEWRAICNGTTSYCYLNTELIVGYTCTTAVLSDYLTPTQHNVAHSDPDGLLSYHNIVIVYHLEVMLILLDMS